MSHAEQSLLQSSGVSNATSLHGIAMPAEAGQHAHQHQQACMPHYVLITGALPRALPCPKLAT